MLASKRSKLAAGGIIALVVLAVVLGGHATSTNLSLPDLSGSCSAKGTTFTTDVIADSLTSTQAWQLNITFTSSQVTPMSYTMGSLFTGTGTTTGAHNVTGSYVLGFTEIGSNPVTTTASTTLVTFTWKTLVYHASTLFHLVTSGSQRTALLDQSLNVQSITTTDGVYTCNLGPGR
ncbi:hypothetical protein AUG19_05020 [archaeon 13_1_20CM_2_54_9]|nr:MAG: hypothetical protein AUJ07_11845 [Crenarchaeota archaeon 13_1_40CM_3_53_5]OLE75561.1 MAG: hypothetical protein AUG19_05020 [archaeon 13_1_20CM_2_54_9]